MKASANSSARPGSTRALTNTPEGFGLTGRSVTLDRRINAVRGDVADIALAGTLFAPHYARPMERRCLAPIAAMREAPGDDAELISELLHGEAFQVIDLGGEWAWGYSAHDHYVGYVRESMLGITPEPGWRVAVRQADLFNAPAPDASILQTLTLGALIDGAPEGEMLRTTQGWVVLADIQPVDSFGADPVAFAEQMIGVPYLMGGRSIDGIDCSGLVQIALALSGIAAPRDSDLQQDALGLPLSSDAALQRGDLVFFPGHVGMMIDGARLIHANGHHQSVEIETLAEVLARIEPDNAAAMTAKRL